MTDLDDINGVGAKRAETLEDAGFETIEDVATAQSDELEDALSSSADVSGIQEHAAELTTDDGEEESDPREVTKELQLDDRDSALYLIGGLTDEMLRLEGRNKIDEVEVVADLAERVIDNVGRDGGTVEVDLDDLSYLYTSVRNMEQQFQSTAGIPGSMVGDARDLRMEIQDLRSGLWPDS